MTNGENLGQPPRKESGEQSTEQKDPKREDAATPATEGAKGTSGSTNR